MGARVCILMITSDDELTVIGAFGAGDASVPVVPVLEKRRKRERPQYDEGVPLRDREGPHVIVAILGDASGRWYDRSDGSRNESALRTWVEEYSQVKN